eukprot:TRINITY_DN2322_c0_g1_i3.p1 TRINITY_DN2322_c0_g1~~TRINITY_DN2322_c0_g1_i3.p1  ORF type:complete len:253 (-),score=63.98 TRINITY_DN2322_c0_g1_i3:29-787(-)
MYKRMGSLVNLEYDTDIRTITVTDGGDVGVELSLEDAHNALTARVCDLIGKGSVPFVLGGGNDQSYANAAGLLQVHSSKGVSVINIDAHFDVRPRKEGKVHSGSPFRLLLEDERFDGRNFVEFASQGSQCGAEHAKYIREKGGSIRWLKDLRRPGVTVAEAFRQTLASLTDYTFVSFDLDAVEGCHAPGVSCPATIGLSAEEALEICFEAGRSPKVRLFDLSEFNPTIEDYRTGRLVVFMFYYFLLGLSLRQ